MSFKNKQFTIPTVVYLNLNLILGGANHNAPYLAHSAFNSSMCYLYKSFILDYACSSIWGCYFVCDKLKLDVHTYTLII